MAILIENIDLQTIQDIIIIIIVVVVYFVVVLVIRVHVLCWDFDGILRRLDANIIRKKFFFFLFRLEIVVESFWNDLTFLQGI